MSGRYKWCKRLLLFTLIILCVRLWDLQIMKGNEMRKLSEQNRIRVKKVIAPRGIIYDKKGKILADTRPSFNMYITPEDIKDFNQTVDGLAKLINLDREEILDKLKSSSGFPQSFPVKIKSDITMEEVAKVEVNRVYLPGVSIQIEPKRNYPYGKMMAHMLGYVSEISDEEIKTKEFKSYSPGDFIGRYGLERAYESYLRGIDGEKRVEVDAMGREVRTLDIKDSIPGNSLYLNVDLEIQTTVEKAYEGKKGGCIAVEPKTGAVTALVSRPAFDPNKFAGGISKEDWKAIITDKSHPLQNRVTQGRYPPGSTFKILTALKALNSGIINERTSFSCRGGFPFGNRVFKCWKKGGHGAVSVHRGIVESCDVFFYNVGLKLGIDRIHEIAEEIGLGRATGIDLPSEKNGLVPSSEWKKKTYGQPWYEGETLSVSIGQGAVWLTPVQLLQLSVFVANEGVTFKPQIVNRIVSPEGKIIKTFEPVMKTNVKIKKDVIKIIKDGMRGVVNEPSGTAYGSRIQTINMSGKTGTAQSVGEKGKNLGDHAWFIAYAPAEEPAVAISVLAEYGGHGSSAAAPIAKLIAENLLAPKIETKEARVYEIR
ncbi:MAG TPA: penicillin-binding protein 2 [Syntrophorhabdaceae bacterium]|nr:penicillin-binding protein 2 [Pseudomonadota bacterium]HNQ62378.1 penicillin-binding protein 2 [Syntrophorhabdaceae bacterium]HNZ58123.1 penicillin-binding protein 2 [Syntrophorhabdaceae bacterium]HOB69434.1 penicillin-binding protein 2 [Syntrophorhabdaceae bacterium]HOF57297.1 penicillin-binding protein 2 [Syntrophorhabdaceae bacterium]